MATTWKTVRVFISSTFRDMHAERDHLVKVTFPRLRQWCEERRLHLVDVDLRWGVTKEEADNGKAIEICLQEIDGSRPFFVCILGNRYGWVPHDLPVEEQYRFQGLQRRTGLSITHLEIVHAALEPLPRKDGERKKVCEQAFFYFRRPDCVPRTESLADLSAEQQKEHEETFFEQEARGRQMLADLKAEIRERFAGQDRVADYEGTWDAAADNPEDDRLKGRLTDLDEFGCRVEAHLRRAIEAKFADHIATLGQPADPLVEERSYHEAFIENRSQVYVPRSDVETELTRYVESDDRRPLVLYGPPGSGKSAVLARWVQSQQEMNGDAFVLARFIGASPASTNLARLLANVCEELVLRFVLTEEVELPHRPGEKISQTMEVPADPVRILEKWPHVLEAAAEKGRIVLVFDALDQLDDSADPSRPAWLPTELPPGTRLLVSVLDQPEPARAVAPSAQKTGSDWLTVLRSPAFRAMPMPLPDASTAAAILDEILRQSCKRLDGELRQELLDNQATRNPLFLAVSLGELRVFGSHQKLAQQIRGLPQLSAPNIDGDIEKALEEVFKQVLERLTQEASRSCQEIVPAIFCLLACARDGLSEEELEGALADELPNLAAEVRQSAMQVVLRQVRPYLMRKGGQRRALLDFYHRSFWKAVQNHYLAEASVRCGFHRRLADYFAKEPWYLEQAGVPTQKSSPRVDWTLQHETYFRPVTRHDGTPFRTPDGDPVFTEDTRKRGSDEGAADIGWILDSGRVRDVSVYSSPEGNYGIVGRYYYDEPESDSPADRIPNLHKVRELGWQHLRAARDTGAKLSPGDPSNVWEPLEGLLCDWRFLEAKVEAGLVFELAEEFGHAVEATPVDYPGRRILRLLAEAIRRDIQFVARHPQTLFQHLWNTCWWYDAPEAAHHYDLSPDHPSEELPWNRSGPKLCELLERWRRIKEAQTPDFYWLRSLRPPPIHLGTAQLAALAVHGEQIQCVAYSPDSQRIAAASDRGKIRIWSAESGELIAKISLPSESDIVKTVAFSPDSRRIAGGGGVWDAETGRELLRLPSAKSPHLTGYINCMAYHPDGRRIVTGTKESFGPLCVWDAETGEKLQEFAPSKKRSSALSIAWSPDGAHVAAVMGGGIHIWEAESGNERLCLDAPEACGARSNVAFSPDSQRVAAGGTDHIVRVWDLQTAAEPTCLRGHEDGVTSVAFSGDERWVVSGSADRTVRVWCAHSGKERHCFRGHEDGVTGVVWSPDGRWVLSGSRDATVRLWDLRGGEPLRELCRQGKPIGCTAFAPRCTGFTPVSHQLATGSADGTVWLWDAGNGRVLKRDLIDPSNLCDSHTEDQDRKTPEVRLMQCSDNGRQLAVALGKKVLVFSLDGRGLSDGETAWARGISPRSVRECLVYSGWRPVAYGEETLVVSLADGAVIARLPGELLHLVVSLSNNPLGSSVFDESEAFDETTGGKLILSYRFDEAERPIIPQISRTLAGAQGSYLYLAVLENPSEPFLDSDLFESRPWMGLRGYEPAVSTVDRGIASPGPPCPPDRYPGADADRAAQLNVEYHRALAQWKALSIWKRLFTKRPQRPEGI